LLRCSRRMLFRTRVRDDFGGRLFLSLKLKDSSSLPKDNGLNEMNEAILLALSDGLFLLNNMYTTWYAFQKALYSWVCRLSTFHSRIFSLGSSCTLQQSKVKARQGKVR
jgi:hypothetical protein